MIKPEKINIEYHNISDLVPYEKNPRYNEDVGAVCESIKLFGFLNPIIVDKKNEIIAGHTRLKACKKLGIKQVPVIRAENLTDQQIKAYRLVDNKTSDFSSWNTDLLSVELSEIIDIDLTVFNFDNLDTQEELRPEKKSLNPYQHCHILITLPIERIEEVAKIIKFCESKGYEYEQSNN